MFGDILHAHIHKYNIRTNLFYAVPSDNEFRVPPKKITEFALLRNNQLTDTARYGIDLDVHDKAKPLTIPYINYFFLSQVTNPHKRHRLYLSLNI